VKIPHPSRSLFASILWLVVCARASAQTPVPYTIVQIRGTAASDDGVVASYRAYRNAGAHYRILCPEPCAADENAIFGLYAGFGQARQQVIALLGVDSLPANQPFDLHVTDDHWCGTASTEFAGDSGQYLPYSTATGTFGCFWFTEPGRYAFPFHYPETSTAPYQVLTSHEFTHTEFFTRHFLSYEDFAKTVSFYVAGFDGGPTITDPCDARLNTLYSGKLILGLCRRNGFQWSQLPAAMQSIDTTFLNGQGGAGYQGPSSVYQFRKALNAVLGSDTLDAFLAAREIDQAFLGDDRKFTTAAGRVSTLSGWASFVVGANAVASATPFHIEAPYVVAGGAPANLTFANAYRITKPNLNDFTFQHPVYFQFKYEPGSQPAGVDASTLRLYHYDGASWQPVAGSRVDAQKMTISAPITASGYYVTGASTTTAPPTLVIPRAVSGPKAHTHVVLFNASILQPASGTLVYHREGVAASPADPSIPYSLDTISGKALVIPDVLAAFGVTDPGTIDVVASAGYLPDVTVRQVDTGGSGFPGSYAETCPVAGALAVEEHALLVAGENAQNEAARFLVRTFASGVSMTVFARSTSGALLATTSLTYPPNTLSRVLPKDFAGGHAVTADETFEIQITAGSALVLRELIESGMAAHNYEYATRIDTLASGPKDVLHLPKAVKAADPDGSTLRTGILWVNPSGSTIKGGVVYHPGDGSPNVVSSYSIPAWHVQATGDLLGELGQTGSGAFELQSSTGALPIAFGRLVHAGGGTPFQVAPEPLFGPLEIAQASDRMTLVVPDDLSAQDFRIGARTNLVDLELTIVVYDATGLYRTQVTKVVAAATSSETSAASFLGVPISGGEVLQFFVDGGHGFLYGSGVATATGAASYQAARRQPFNY
jgi:hypothetical protein